jgi:hypothetical protein
MTDSFRFTRARAFLACIAVLLFAADLRAAAPAQAGAPNGRVIVLGFDGADARTAAELMDKGQLPNLAALREKGTFTPLETTNPAESPVSWAAQAPKGRDSSEQSDRISPLQGWISIAHRFPGRCPGLMDIRPFGLFRRWDRSDHRLPGGCTKYSLPHLR